MDNTAQYIANNLECAIKDVQGLMRRIPPADWRNKVLSAALMLLHVVEAATPLKENN